MKLSTSAAYTISKQCEQQLLAFNRLITTWAASDDVIRSAIFLGGKERSRIIVVADVPCSTATLKRNQHPRDII